MSIGVLIVLLTRFASAAGQQVLWVVGSRESGFLPTGSRSSAAVHRGLQYFDRIGASPARRSPHSRLNTRRDPAPGKRAGGALRIARPNDSRFPGVPTRRARRNNSYLIWVSVAGYRSSSCWSRLRDAKHGRPLRQDSDCCLPGACAAPVQALGKIRACRDGRRAHEHFLGYRPAPQTAARRTATIGPERKRSDRS